MIKISLLLGLLLLIPNNAPADQVNLKNGDRVTGKILKKDGDKLALKSDVFGTVNIPWAEITRLTSDEVVTVALADGGSVQGKVAIREGALEVASSAGTQSIEIALVSAIRNADEQKAYEKLQHPGLLSLWIGYADVGASLARGNSTSNTITTSVKSSRETRTDKVSLYFTQIYSKGKLADGTVAATAQAVRGGWAYNRRFSSRLFVNTFNDYEYDAFQSLDLRLVAGAGLGLEAIKKERTKLYFAAGASYDHEKFSTELTRNSAEAYWGNSLTYRVFKVMALTQSFRMFNNLSETGLYRINFDFGTTTDIKKWLAWQLTFSDRYLSNPVPGHKTNDILLTTGVRFTFAQ
jgi:hypothetical protein